MITRTTAVWDLIRAADPVATVDVSGASKGPAAQELLHRITAEDSTAPGPYRDVLTVLEVGPSQVLTPRRHGLVAGLAAVAVVLLLVATVFALRRQHRTTALSPDRQTTAAGYAKALLAELPLPKGARRADTPPIPELKQSPFPGNGILDAQVAWWTVPGSFAATVAHIGQAGTLPAHWKITVSSDDGTDGHRNGWLIEVRDPNARFVSSVDVTVAAHGTKVGLAVLVDTYAVPVRTTEQVIPASVDSASFTFNGGGGRSYSSRLTLTFTGSRVKALAREINATPTFVMLAVVSCPAPQGSVAVTFRSGSSRWSLDINDGSFLCNAPMLSGTNGTSVALTPSSALVTDVLAAAGLPSNYFSR